VEAFAERRDVPDDEKSPTVHAPTHARASSERPSRRRRICSLARLLGWGAELEKRKVFLSASPGYEEESESGRKEVGAGPFGRLSTRWRPRARKRVTD